MEHQERNRKLTASDTLRALLYGVEALKKEANRKYTQRKVAQAYNILLDVERLLSQGIADGTEAR